MKSKYVIFYPALNTFRLIAPGQEKQFLLLYKMLVCMYMVACNVCVLRYFMFSLPYFFYGGPLGRMAV